MMNPDDFPVREWDVYVCGRHVGTVYARTEKNALQTAKNTFILLN